ncbi:TetR/AcrR family transcriptional regulator [Pendulispora albinea]|uniref:TetR/AcrR family transcriptional regulator n=1 Tax=Pendulispora albinea TaxID=2741071 RepID=A0ABZ2M9W5_9BACT
MAAARKKAPRRKPIQTRSQETVRAIVDAAARVLARRGYAATTTNHVAARAGVSIGSFYEYFRDKDAVVRAVLERHLAAGEALFAERAAALGAGQGTLRELLGALVQAFIDFHADDPRLHRVLSHEVPHSAATVRRVLELERRIVAIIAGILAAHPEARVRDPRLAAQLCVETVDALAHRWIVDEGGEPIAAEALAHELTELLVAYVARGTSPRPRGTSA